MRSLEKVYVAATMGALLMVSACASSPEAKLAESFPTKAELNQELNSNKAKAVEFTVEAKAVETWTLQGPFPELIGRTPKAAAQPWEKVLAEGIKGKDKLAMTEEAACQAREIGNFYVQQGAYPNDSLEQFITARCGSIEASSGFWRWELDDLIEQGSLEETFAQVKDGLTKYASSITNEDHLDLGIWYGERDARRVMIITRARRKLDLAPTSRQMDSQGMVVLRGKVLGGVDRVGGMINRGEFGHSECQTVESVALPAFEVRCKGNPADTNAYLTLYMGKKDQVMSRSMLRQMVWGALAPSNEYRGSAVRAMLMQKPNAGPVTQETFQAELLANVNHVRAFLQFPLFELADQQAASVGLAAPHIFAPRDDESSDEHDARMDKIYRGLMAGWDVKAPISRGTFVTDSSGASSMVDVVSTLLEHPGGRQALLERSESLFAAGGVVKDGRVAVAAFVYEKALNADYNTLAGKVFRDVSAQRKALGKNNFKRLSSFNSAAEDLSKSLAKGDRSLGEVGDKLAGKVSNGLNSGVRYYQIWSPSLDDLPLSDALLESSSLRGVVAVASYKPEGSPWWLYGIVIVTPQK